jgi:hypothetical protein
MNQALYAHMNNKRKMEKKKIATKNTNNNKCWRGRGEKEPTDAVDGHVN